MTSAYLVNENFDEVVLASAARTTLQTGADYVNPFGRYLTVVLDVTANPVSVGLTLTIQGKDAAGVYYTLLVGAAVSTISTNVYRIGPGLPATANVSANVPMPRIWRVIVAVADADSGTYSLTGSYSI